MFNFFKPKVKKIFISTDSYVDIKFFIFEDLPSKKDDPDCMVYLKTPYYHSFGKMSQKQFNQICEDFSFQEGSFSGKTPSMEELIKHPISIHKNYETAKNTNYRLNLAIPYLFYCPESKVNELTDNQGKKYLNIALKENIERYQESFNSSSDEEKKTFTPINIFKQQIIDAHYVIRDKLSCKTILTAIQEHSVLEVIYNDYNTVLFNHTQKIDYKNPDLLVFLDTNFDAGLSKLKNYTEIINYLLQGQNVSKGFESELTSYFINNCLQTHQTKNESFCIYTLNQNLINQIKLLSMFLDFSKYTFSDLKFLLVKFQENRLCYTESMFFPEENINEEDDYSFSFCKNLTFLKNQKFDLYKVFFHWNVFFTTMRASSKILDEVTFSLDPKRYKDMNRVYNYLGKRLAETIENFNLKNFNSENFNNNISEVELIEIGSFKIEVIKDFKKLFEIGMQLDNCAGSKITLDYYTDKIVYKLSDGNQTFLGCIKDGQFHQLKGYKNSSPDFNLFNSLFNQLVSLKFIDVLENQKIQKRYIKKHGHSMMALYDQECIQHN